MKVYCMQNQMHAIEFTQLRPFFADILDKFFFSLMSNMIDHNRVDLFLTQH